MKKALLLIAIAVSCWTGCKKSTSPPASTAKAGDAVQQKLLESSGGSGTDCGRLDVQASMPQLKTASDCAMQASRDHHAFYVAYDMPGMTVGVAGNSEGKLFSVQGEGTGTARTLTTGACPAQLRVASSGRISCFAPGDMGSMGPGHGGVGMSGNGMVNPHAAGGATQPGKKQ